MIKFDFDKFREDALSQIGQLLVEKAQHNMSTVSNGRVYVIGGKTHIASKAGDSPNNLSGELKSTIRYEISGDILEFGAGDETINYAKYLEKGTRRIKVRPSYTKSILENKEMIDKQIKYLFNKHARFTNV